MRERVKNRTTRPQDGVVIYGLFLDGAGWDIATKHIVDPEPKELFAEAPSLWIKPTNKGVDAVGAVANVAHKEGGNSSYECPLYKTSERRGVLSTTGQSTNFVMMIDMPCEGDAEKWIVRGCCLLTQLDD